MKLTLFRSNLPPSSIPGAELDVTPVMNMFVILIPFLVSMAVFTHMSIIEFSLPPNVNSAMNSAESKPEPKLTIRIGPDYLGIILGAEQLDSLTVTGDDYPFAALKKQLELRKKERNFQEEVIVASRDVVPFKQVVKVMDICREVGLAKIGLSSATEDPDANP